MAQANQLVLVDTNILFDYLRKRNPKVGSQLVAIGEGNLSISIITYGEVIVGARKRELKKTKLFLNRFKIIQLDKYISAKMKSIFNEAYYYEKLMADALIGATAITYGLPIWTHNKKDFSYLKGIRFYQPKP